MSLLFYDYGGREAISTQNAAFSGMSLGVKMLGLERLFRGVSFRA
jgi:hypothetical protein